MTTALLPDAVAPRRRSYSCAETAVLVRAVLKDTFKATYPTVRFSVRSSTYAGGASIHIHWTDGPAKSDVNAVVQRFAGASFDGMTDSMSYHDTTFNGEPCSFASNFVFAERGYSTGFLARCLASVMRAYRLPASAAPAIVQLTYKGASAHLDSRNAVNFGGIDVDRLTERLAQSSGAQGEFAPMTVAEMALAAEAVAA